MKRLLALALVTLSSTALAAGSATIQTTPNPAIDDGDWMHLMIESQVGTPNSIRAAISQSGHEMVYVNNAELWLADYTYLPHVLSLWMAGTPAPFFIVDLTPEWDARDFDVDLIVTATTRPVNFSSRSAMVERLVLVDGREEWALGAATLPEPSGWAILVVAAALAVAYELLTNTGRPHDH